MNASHELESIATTLSPSDGDIDEGLLRSRVPSSLSSPALSELSEDEIDIVYEVASEIAQEIDACAAPTISLDDAVPLCPDIILDRARLEQLPTSLQEACRHVGWAQLMPVQALALPYVLARHDVMVQSRTGSGKTGAYLLPLLQHLSAGQANVQALVLVPTRELAVQVEHEARELFAYTDLSVVAMYGGVGYDKQHAALRSGAQLVVGTPGRVLDHLLRRSFNLDSLRVLIFDEADRMLSIGFYPDMKEVQSYLPQRKVLTCLFSATYPPHVLTLTQEFMSNPSMLSLSQKHVHVAEVEHSYCICKSMDKDRTLIRLLETENPASAIIFCNTKANVHYVAAVLQGFGYNADELSADLSQNKREAILGKIRRGQLRFLVATDVAARGIDIPELSHVFLFEPPEDHESYIHRAGRTGRAGAAGTVISLVDVMQKMELERIAKRFNIPLIERENPTDALVTAATGQRLLALLEAQYRTLTGLERERIARFCHMAHMMSAQSQDTDMLLAMLLDRCYQEHVLGTASSRMLASSARAPLAKAEQKTQKKRRHGSKNSSHVHKKHKGDDEYGDTSASSGKHSGRRRTHSSDELQPRNSRRR